MPGVKFHLIGLCGYAQVGKDTVASLLRTHAGFQSLAFAEPLKAQVQEAFSVEPLVLQRPEFKERPMHELALSRCTEVAFINAALRAIFEAGGGAAKSSDELTKPRSPRQIMQWWGTEYRRAQDPLYWVHQTSSRIDYAQRVLRHHNLVVTDVRFPNEAEALRRRGGLLWQITRPGRTGGEHASATDGTEFKPDAVINNSHDLKHLQQLVLGEYRALDAGLERVEVTIA